jgi:hypothetical protein
MPVSPNFGSLDLARSGAHDSAPLIFGDCLCQRQASRRSSSPDGYYHPGFQRYHRRTAGVAERELSVLQANLSEARLLVHPLPKELTASTAEISELKGLFLSTNLSFEIRHRPCLRADRLRRMRREGSPTARGSCVTVVSGEMIESSLALAASYDRLLEPIGHVGHEECVSESQS